MENNNLSNASKKLIHRECLYGVLKKKEIGTELVDVFHTSKEAVEYATKLQGMNEVSIVAIVFPSTEIKSVGISTHKVGPVWKKFLMFNNGEGVFNQVPVGLEKIKGIPSLLFNNNQIQCNYEYPLYVCVQDVPCQFRYSDNIGRWLIDTYLEDRSKNPEEIVREVFGNAVARFVDTKKYFKYIDECMEHLDSLTKLPINQIQRQVDEYMYQGDGDELYSVYALDLISAGSVAIDENKLTTSIKEGILDKWKYNFIDQTQPTIEYVTNELVMFSKDGERFYLYRIDDPNEEKVYTLEDIYEE